MKGAPPRSTHGGHDHTSSLPLGRPRRPPRLARRPALRAVAARARLRLLDGRVDRERRPGRTSPAGKPSTSSASASSPRLLALLTLGLVQPWGERFPRRLVLAAGDVRRDLAGADLGLRLPRLPERRRRLEASSASQATAGTSCCSSATLPLLLWAPLLAAVTWDYSRRTRQWRGSALRSDPAR